MKRIAWLIAALTIVPAITLAQPAAAERDLGRSGAMTLEELSREPIQFELNVPYADTGNPRHRLDIYLPNDRATAALPVIVFFHGGEWKQGDKSDGAGRLMPLVRTGDYAGISAGYRLSGEATWPAQIHDCKAAIRWVRANAAKYGLDADHIGVWGRSAGGHLVLMLGVTDGMAEFEGDIGPHAGVSSKVAGVANFFGASDLMALIGMPSDLDRTSPQAPEAMLIGGALPENPQKANAASPVTYVTLGDPPVLTVHGTADRTIHYNQAMRLDAALRKAGVRSYFVTVIGAGHGNFGIAADDRVRLFFDKYLCGRDIAIPTEPVNNWR